MPRIPYVNKRLSASSRAVIDQANQIIREYVAAGYTLTLRQLYYQFVARDLLPNRQQSYKRLGSIISDARLTGRVDWNAIEDRTRFLRKRSHWENPAGVIESAAVGYGKDLWRGQDVRVEAWIEKDALIGVLEGICKELDVPYFSCRGYTSQSEVWRAAERQIGYGCEEVVVLHLGDHDPSGMDMTRDIQDRLRMFGAPSTVRRIALNMDQVDQYSPPPNPAKLTDARASGYVAEYGYNSWELDALEPQVLEALVREHVEDIWDRDLFEDCREEQEQERKLLEKVSDNWDDVISLWD